MIASLRGRLVAGVLVLAAAGMLLVGAVTYATQRSYLLDRVDSAAGRARPSRLQQRSSTSTRQAAFQGGGAAAAARRPAAARRQDTYGQQRDRSGDVLDGELPRPGRDRRGSPTCRRTSRSASPRPSDTPHGDYRVLASPARDGTITVAAIPMSATNETLERLLLVEGIVIVAVLALVGGFALVVVRVGLLPLDRMGHTAAAIAGGDLSHRVETTDPRTEVGRLGLALNRMLDRLEDAFAAREASQERLRRFIADASHELRTPLV